MEINGAQILIKALEDQGVEIVFGYPGGAVLEICDALNQSSLKHILVRHEQGGAHASSGYARALGKVGVCFATSGPGATNLVTGIATAYMDSVPMVIITGQVSKNMVGTDAFQEVDITGITSPITKHNYLVQTVEELPQVIAEAFHIAQSGRPGPVLVDIPRDVSMAISEYLPVNEVDIRSYKPNLLGHPSMIKKAVKLIKEAENLVICAGGGVISSESSDLLKELVGLKQATVVSTLMGLGAFSGTDSRFKGMLGTYGSEAANLAVQNSDCFLALGMRFDDRVVGNPNEFAPNAKIIHIDVDPAEIGKNVRADLPIVGDLQSVLQAINLELAKDSPIPVQASQIQKKENKMPEQLTVPWVIEQIQALAPADTLVTTDVGQHQIWTAHSYKFNQPRTFISSGGLGTMGYGIPAALGAQLAKPKSLVVAVTGDGSFQMGLPELGTIAELGLPIKIIIFNNRTLGMVRQLQHHYCEKRYSLVDFNHTLDFMTLAKAYGAKAYRIPNTQEAPEVLKEALNNEQFTIIECPVSTDDLVLPIVLAGNNLGQMTY